MQHNRKRTLSKSILRVCLVFTICLSLGVGLLGFYTYATGMMGRYQNYLRSILTYTALEIDTDDLAQCIASGKTSKSYDRAQHMLNQIKETHAIEYIYILKPLSPVGADNMQYVMTGVTQAELEEDPHQTLLGDLSGTEYDEKVSAFYIDCMVSGTDVSFFANYTSFGYMYTGMIPLKTTGGEAIAVLSVDITIQELVNTLVRYALICLLGCVLFSVLFLRILYRWMRRRVIRPVEQMENAAGKFITESHSDTSPDELHFDMPDITTGDEIQSLSAALCKMSDDVKQYLSDMLTQAREKERIASELSVAAQIQEDMLPSIFPAFPSRCDFDIYATMQPAKEVGGDFYDFFLVDDTHLAMVMADVSGKGVPAALFMVIAKTLLKNRAKEGGTPSEILADVNNQLCDGNKAQLFVTVWMAILDLTTGDGIAANAGHEHPVVCRKEGSFELVKYKHSLALAVMEDIPFRQHTFHLQPGDTLFVYTDGVPEATDAKEKQYGTDRMLSALNENPSADLHVLLDTLHKDIRSFVGEAPQFDDITMLGIRFYGIGGLPR